MLALTTGVSAIVGALHHLRRRHARGLRDMVRLLYARELRPLLNGQTAENGQTQKKGLTQEKGIELGGGRVIHRRPALLGWGASSETFARHSRGWSVAIGFLLAFFLNVDSLDLPSREL